MPAKAKKTKASLGRLNGSAGKKKSAKKAAAPSHGSTTESGGNAVADPRQVRERAVNAVLNAAEDIIGSIVVEAGKGSHTAAKFLFDFAGISEPPAPAARDDESLAAMLLRSLREGPQLSAASGSGEAPDASPTSVNLNVLSPTGVPRLAIRDNP